MSRLKVAVFGAGNWGRNHVRTLSAMAEVDLTAVCDTSPVRREQVARQYPGVITTGELEKALAAADAVVIARPDGMVDVRLRDPSKPRPAPSQPGVQQPVPGQPGGGQLPNQGLMPVPGPAQPSPRAFTPSGVPVPQPAMPGQPMPPPTVQQPAPGQPVPFGRPSPSLGRRIPPIPQDPSGQPLPAPTQ